MVYFIIFILLVILFFRYDINGKTKYRDFWYRFVLVVLILIAGLRWRLGSDTPVYLEQFYSDTPFLWDLQTEDLLLGGKPLWKLLNSIVYTWFGRFYVLQIIQSAIVNCLLFKYIKRHSNYIFFCALLYFFWLYFGLSMQIMKASISIVICLFANDCLIEKKWIRSYLLYFLALLFHPQTILLLLMPFFMSLRFNIKGVFFLVVCFILGYTIQYFLGDFLLIIEKIGDEAIMQKATGYAGVILEDNNSFLRQVSATGILIFEILSLLYIKKCVKIDISKYEPFLMLGLASILIQTNVELFYRYVYYFSLYFIIIFSFIAQYLSNKRMISKELSFVRVVVFFLPLLLCILVNNYFQLPRYVPYYSVIEMKIDKTREDVYMMNGKPAANKNEF